jgi:hypothetical protein
MIFLLRTNCRASTKQQNPQPDGARISGGNIRHDLIFSLGM